MRTAVLVVLGVSAFLAVVLVVVAALGARRFQARVDSEVEAMREEVDTGEAAAITEEDLEGLPEPVRRYLRFAGVVGRPPVAYARNKQRGEFRLGPDGEWMELEAVQHFTTRPPGLLWDATIEMMPLVSFYVRDRFYRGEGHMLGTLAGTVAVVDEKGPEIDQGTFLRLLGEGVWFPSVFLEEYVTWEAIDETSARLLGRSGGEEVEATVHFDRDGALRRVVAQRYYSEGDGEARLETWKGVHGGYEEVDGYMVPTESSAGWELEEGGFEYVRLEIDGFEFESAAAAR